MKSYLSDPNQSVGLRQWGRCYGSFNLYTFFDSPSMSRFYCRRKIHDPAQSETKKIIVIDIQELKNDVLDIPLSILGHPSHQNAPVGNHKYTHFYRIREEGGSGRPPTVHLRTDDIT